MIAPSHLLSKFKILAQFSIAKRISKSEIDKATKKIKIAYKEKNPEKIKQLIEDVLIENTKKYLSSEIPPGIVFPKKNYEKEKLDKYYMELSSTSNIIAKKFVDKKLTKHQICFIINAIINILGIGEEDFENFYESFQKYKNDNMEEDE